MPRVGKTERAIAGYDYNALAPLVTVGAKSGNNIDTTIQLKDQFGKKLGRAGSIEAYLSDAAGGALTASAPNGGWALQGSTIKLNEFVTNKYGLWVSDNTGLVTIRVTHSIASVAWYLNFLIGGPFNDMVSYLLQF